MPKAYPVYQNDYRESIDTIRGYLDGFENLQTIGRNGTHRYNNMDHSMLSGILAASSILGEKRDLWDINTEQEYLEEADASLEEAVELVVNPLDPVASGAGTGVSFGLLMFFLTLHTILFADQDAARSLALLGNYFIGYTVSWPGAFLILLEAGLAGFIGGSSVAWLRNMVMKLLVTRGPKPEL